MICVKQVPRQNSELKHIDWHEINTRAPVFGLNAYFQTPWRIPMDVSVVGNVRICEEDMRRHVHKGE